MVTVCLLLLAMYLPAASALPAWFFYFCSSSLNSQLSSCRLQLAASVTGDVISPLSVTIGHNDFRATSYRRNNTLLHFALELDEIRCRHLCHLYAIYATKHET